MPHKAELPTIVDMNSDFFSWSHVGRVIGITLVCVLVSACAGSGNRLAGTDWQLVEFQSMDDSIGTIRPGDPTKFTMRLNADGTVSMRLDCNRATGTWSSDDGAGGNGGSFMFGPLASTRALCPPPNLDERIARDAEYVRSYLIDDGRLYLSLMADAGIYAWERTPAR